jgi:quercetin dioxygenase-like cupin family protein
VQLLKIGTAIVCFLVCGAAFGQGMPISTDGTDPTTWDPALDAVEAAPKNHKVIYEDSEIRVLSVTVAPGESEKLHHHRWPSIIVFDRLVPLENRDASGNLIPRTNMQSLSAEPPMLFRVPPQAAHSVTNVGTTPLHLVRTEFKHGFPKQP